MLLQACAGFMIPGVQVHVLDEPFAGINPVVKDTLIDLILHENRTHGADVPDRQPRDGDHPPHLPARDRDDRRPRRRRRPARRDRAPRGRDHRLSRALVRNERRAAHRERRACRLPARRRHPARLEHRGAAERDHAGDRPERRRQVDAAAHRLRVPRAEPGQHHVSRPADRGAAPERAQGRRHQLRDAGHQQLSRPHRGREPAHGRLGVPPRHASGCGASSSAPTRPFRRSPRSGARAPANCPAGRGACSRSRAR